MTQAHAESGEFRTLIQAVQAGDERAAELLYHDFSRHVIAVVGRCLSRSIRSKFDSQDLAQAVWASVFADLRQLDGIREPRQLVGLLTAIARHKVTDENRRRTQTQKHAVQKETSITVAADQRPLTLVGSDPTPSQLAMARELWQRWQRGLPDDCRQIARLKLDGLTNRAIAKELGINEKTVRRKLQRLAQGTL